MRSRCLKRFAVVGVVLAGVVAVGCGEHNSLGIEDISAERLADGRVEVTLTIQSGGMHDWSEKDEYCVVVTWFEPGTSSGAARGDPVGGDAEAPCMSLPEFDPERDTEILTVEQCFTETIPLAQTVTHVLESSGPLPFGRDLRITAKLTLGDEVEAAVPLILHGAKTVMSP